MSEPEQKPLPPRSMKTVEPCAALEGVPPMMRGLGVLRRGDVVSFDASEGAPLQAMLPVARPTTRNAKSEPGLRLRRTLRAARAIVKRPTLAASAPQFGRGEIGQRHHHTPVVPPTKTRVRHLRTRGMGERGDAS